MERERIRGSDPSAYQGVQDRQTGQGPLPSTRYGLQPVVSTTGPALNKPLPPSPEAGRKRRKPPVSLRSLVRRRSSDADDTSHLHPATAQNQRSSSANSLLSPDPGHLSLSIQISRSMPTSPMPFPENYSPPSLARALSSATNYSGSSQVYADHYQGRSQYGTQYSPTFAPSPPTHRRTYPEDTTSTSSSGRRQQRPHTWLSPTESNDAFQDVTEVRLFAEATYGLPDGNAFSTVSPVGPPQLQGSLYSRGQYQDTIPIREPQSRRPHSTSHGSTGWQSYRYPSPPPTAPLPSSSSSHSQSRRLRYSHQSSSSVQQINLDLERLGISDEEDDDDELPDYAQSQAEMSARKRKEAADRAKELEERWRRSRRRGGQ